MIKATLYVILFYFLTGIYGLSAQSPGYMGKHVSVGYGAYTSPGVASSNDYATLNFLHEGFLELAVSKNVSLGLSARYYNTAVNNEGDASGKILVNGSYQSAGGNPKSFTSVKGFNYTVYAKFFRRNYVAPWGKYFIIGPTLNTFEASYNPAKVYFSYTTVSSQGKYQIARFSDFGPERQSYIKFDLTFGNGRSRMIGSRVVLDYGYNINAWGATTLIFDLIDLNTYTGQADDYIKMISSKRVRGVNRFNVFLKVAVLLF
jgi:hypothetical protein